MPTSEPRLVFEARLLFKARLLLVQSSQTPGLYSRPSLYLRPGLYSRIYGIFACVVVIMSGATPMHDSHRLFLQTFMSQGMLGSQEVNDAFQESCTRYGGNCDSVNLLCFLVTLATNLCPEPVFNHNFHQNVYM